MDVCTKNHLNLPSRFSLHQFMQIHVSRERFPLQPQNEYKMNTNNIKINKGAGYFFFTEWNTGDLKDIVYFLDHIHNYHQKLFFAYLLLFFLSHSNTSKKIPERHHLHRGDVILQATIHCIGYGVNWYPYQ